MTTDQHGEIISGQKLVEALYDLIDARRICRMEIPRTDYAWFTLLLGVQKEKGSNYLLIDKVAGFEKALSRSQNQDISLEYLEKGIPLTFKTRVIKCLQKAILAEWPNLIYRVQKRAYYRIEAPLATEISFQVNPQMEGKGSVKDYSLGGIAFFMEGNLNLKVDDRIINVILRLPQGNEWISFGSSLAVIRRLGQDSNGKSLCAIEFLEMSEATKERLGHHLFKEQRRLLQRTKTM
jgi:c-di-GMP-binding flagellar brake protein YcgR